MRRVVDDLFTQNPEYAKTALNPWDIIEPIGYDTFTGLLATIRENAKIKRLELFQFPEEVMQKCMINRKPFQNDSMLEVQIKQGKGTWIGGENFKYFHDKQELIKGQCQRFEWFPEHPDYGDTNILRFMQLLSYIPRDHLLNIDDYAISNYTYFIQSQNLTYQVYLNEFLNREFIEYKISGVHLSNPKFTSPSSMWTTMPNVDVTDKGQVQRLVDSINSQNLKNDPMYKGLNLFIGLSELGQDAENYSDEEFKFLKVLQYYLTMISGTLADGQNAIIKIYSNFRHKTNEYMFLLRTMFYKIVLVKPALSSLFSNQKFIICEGFKKAAGLKIYAYLIKNYDLLKQSGQQALLVKPNEIFKADFLQHLQDFNNILVNKFLKPIYTKILSNSGAIYVPNLTYVQGRLKLVWSKHPYEALLEYIKSHYDFEGKPVSEMKLNAPTQVEAPANTRQPYHYNDRFYHKPRGNQYNNRGHHNSSERQPFRGQRRPYSNNRRF